MGVDGSDPIEIVDPDPAWASQGEAAAAEVADALEAYVVEVQHIGSTAVSGLPAKPVIDLLVGVRTLDDTPAIVAAVTGLGYEYVPEFEDELPDRRYFRRFTHGVRSHQVHLVERTDTEWWDRHVAFRDWLRTHDDDRDAYADLKRRLAVEHRDDRAAYTDAKSDFIHAIERRLGVRPTEG
jgi:GrpB-like predicted nucleotidyltransferase (UPF0157 family)